MSDAWAGGSSRGWRKLRARVLADNATHNAGRCTLALDAVCTGVADTVHHTQGRAITGDDPRYLAAVCRACNLKVGDPQRARPRPRPVSRW